MADKDVVEGGKCPIPKCGKILKRWLVEVDVWNPVKKEIEKKLEDTGLYTCANGHKLKAITKKEKE